MKNYNLDNHKLIYHLDRLNAWNRGEDIYPLYISVSPSGACNLKCIFCAYSYLPKKNIFLKRDALSKILKEFKGLGIKAIFYSGEGEPFMNRELSQMIIDTANCNIDAAVNTNGILLTKNIAKDIIEELTFIRFSVNAGNADTYKKLHGVNKFDTVIDNIADAVKLKKEKKAKVTIGIQCLLLNENINSLLDLAKTLKNIRVDYLAIKPFLKHPQIHFNNSINILEKNDLIRRLESMSTDKFKVVIRRNAFERNKARTYKHCLSLPFMAEIDCTGDVYPCGPYLGHKEFVYGNIYKKSFKKIWNSKSCRSIRDFISTKLDVSKCMPNCRNDAVNRFLWQLKHEPEHVNFI